MIAYIDHLERRGELDLEAATEFLVLIAALLELKSRLLLPGEELEELIELDPGEAAEELLARLLDAHRYRAAAGAPARAARRRRRAIGSARRRCRRALRRASLAEASAVYDPATLAAAIGELLDDPASRSTCATWSVPKVTVAERLAHLRALLRRGSFTFDEAVAQRRPGDGRGHAVRAARALQAGRADLDPGRAVRRDHDRRDGARGAASGADGVTA